MLNVEINLVLFIVLLNIIGLWVSFYIYNKKTKKKKLICPSRTGCDKVVNSKYSKIMGISLEVIGVLYYLFSIVIYSFIFLFSGQMFLIISLLFFIHLVAFIFSLRLIFLQAFVIKRWCMWCLFSGFISISVFVLSFFLFKEIVFIY